MENQDISISISVPELTDIVKGRITASILEAFDNNKVKIKESLNQYFNKGVFNDKKSSFESSLDWAVENSFRIGLDKAMTEMGFSEIIAAKAKEILSSNDFIAELAEAKIRASLGLPNKATGTNTCPD
jgi:hypothetical protein